MTPEPVFPRTDSDSVLWAILSQTYRPRDLYPEPVTDPEFPGRAYVVTYSLEGGAR
jgi:hypothetical protein